MPATYLDSSAIVKLVVEEIGSAAPVRHLRGRRPLVSSVLARTEVARAVLRHGDEAVARARAVLGGIDLVLLSDRILDLAGTLMPVNVRCVDALHLATARLLSAELDHLVTYDQRMVAAAHLLGIATVSPD